MIIQLQRGIKTFVDKEDFKRVSQFHWWFRDGRGAGYVVRDKRYGLRKRNKKKTIRLHRFIMGLNNGDKRIVDHIDKNTLNNRKSNLRICTQSENQQNRKKQCNNTSGVTGVNWWKTQGYWQAVGYFKGKKVWCKYFRDFNDAVKSRKEFERQYFVPIKPSIDIVVQ